MSSIYDDPINNYRMVCNGMSEPNRSVSCIGDQSFKRLYDSPFDVIPQLMPPIQRTIHDQLSYTPMHDPGSIAYVTQTNSGVGAPMSCSHGVVCDSPTMSSGQQGNMLMTLGIVDPTPVPYRGCCAPQKQQPRVRDGKRIDVPGIQQPYVHDTEVRSRQTYYGRSFTERIPKWDQIKDIKTADSAFGSIPFLSMLQSLMGLAGTGLLSLSGTFNNLTPQQKQQIQSNTSPEMYSAIEAIVSSAIDVGDTETISLASRVDANTFANNMVEVLSQVRNMAELNGALNELRHNKARHGKDKIPTVEYKVQTGFGEVGLIIDGYGEYKQNVPSQVASSMANFNRDLTAGQDMYEQACYFVGEISGNTLTVNEIISGHLIPGPRHIIDGMDVTSNTYIHDMRTRGGDPLGTYKVSESSKTLPNTHMVLHRVTPKDPSIAAQMDSIVKTYSTYVDNLYSLQYAATSEKGNLISLLTNSMSNVTSNNTTTGGGGGGGGMGGFGSVFGISIFGEASKLVAESIPTLDGVNQGRIMKALAMAKGMAGHAPWELINWKGMLPFGLSAFLK